MYKITAVTDGVEYLLHDPQVDGVQVYDDELIEEMGKTATFTFTMPAGHPHIDKVIPLASEIFVYRDGVPIFIGREISPNIDLYNTRVISCVGMLSYLADSMIAPFNHEGTLTSFLQTVIAKHNAQVEPRKQFTLGRVNVLGETGYREIGDYQDALGLLSSLIVGAYGGFLHARRENGINYLDYVTDYGGTNSQVVRFGENVLDISRAIDATDVITCLIATGAEDENGNAPTVTVEDSAAIAKYGKIWAHVSFDKASTTAALSTAAANYLSTQTIFPESVEFTALDLSIVDINIDALKVGYWTTFISTPHGISGEYLLRKRTLHVTAPQNDAVTFGSELAQTLTGTSLSDKKAAEQANADLESEMQEYTDEAVTSSEEKTTEKFAEFSTTIDGLTSKVGTIETAQTEQGKKITENTSLISQTASSIRQEVTQKITTVENNVEKVEEYASSIEQTAQKINWVVSSGSSASSMSLTSQMLSIITNQIKLNSPDMSNYLTIQAYQTGGNIAPYAGTLYLGNSSSTVYCRNMLETNYFYAYTQIHSGGNCVVDGQISAYSGRFSGWCYAPDWTNGSDRKLKDDILPLPEAEFTDFVLSLQPVQYRYKADTSQKTRFGFIAQDIREDLGKIGYGESGALVTAARLNPEDEEDTLTLSYNDLIAPLVVLAQKQQKEIEKLKERVNALEGN